MLLQLLFQANKLQFCLLRREVIVYLQILNWAQVDYVIHDLSLLKHRSVVDRPNLYNLQ